jgi:hypothetical protein
MVMIYLFRSGLDDRMFCFSLAATCATLPDRFAPWVNLGGSDVRAELEKSLQDDLDADGFRMIRKRDAIAKDGLSFSTAGYRPLTGRRDRHKKRRPEGWPNIR